MKPLGSLESVYVRLIPGFPIPLEGLHLGWCSFRENVWIDVVRQKGQSDSLKPQLMSDINSFDLNKQTRQVSSVLMVHGRLHSCFSICTVSLYYIH